jgi:hypothetical protein
MAAYRTIASVSGGRRIGLSVAVNRRPINFELRALKPALLSDKV